MYFSPSSKYFINKNDFEEKEERKKEEIFKNYLNKRKNKESFANRGSQTLTRFKRNQVVSTSSLKDSESDSRVNQKINSLSWNLIDAFNEEKNKKDDEGKIFQKKLERIIKVNPTKSCIYPMRDYVTCVESCV